MPADSANRTLVLSVVAIDMVGYSRVSVAEQMSLKDNFNQALVRAIRHLSVADRIILDTGDGVAMGFLGDPEDALYVAMFMHDAVNRIGSGIRIGINLGPVKLSTGVGGHPNIIGDGINVAERIMMFAEPGQCTVSRPFYELMSRISGHYATLFEFAGVHTDKQVRAHDVYVVGKSDAAFQQARQGVQERAAQRLGQSPVAEVPTDAPKPFPAVSRTPTSVAATPTAATNAASAETHSGLIDFLENRKKVATSATLLAIVAVGLGATLAYRMTRALPAEGNAAVVAATRIATPSKDKDPVTQMLSPAPVVANKGAASVPVPNVEPKATPVKPAVSPVTALPSVAPAALNATPNAKPVVAPAVIAPSNIRDKPADSKTDKSARVEKPSVREPNPDTPRKPSSRTGAEREQNAPVTTAPVVPAYQAPVQAPRTESVAPTPPPSPASAQQAPAALSTEAVVVSRNAPTFPVEGIRQGLQTGFVKARLTIDGRGNVSSVDILESKPIPAFGREARNAAKDWKFNAGTPGRTYDIEFTFKL